MIVLELVLNFRIRRRYLSFIQTCVVVSCGVRVLGTSADWAEQALNGREPVLRLLFDCPLLPRLELSVLTSSWRIMVNYKSRHECRGVISAVFFFGGLHGQSVCPVCALGSLHQSLGLLFGVWCSGLTSPVPVVVRNLCDSVLA